MDGPVKLTNARIVDLTTGRASAPTTVWVDRSRLAREPHSPAPDTLDLDGRFVIPGLWDAHTHYGTWALSSTHLNLGATHTVADLLQALQSHDAAHPGLQPIIATNVRDNRWPTPLRMSEFDDAFPHRPVAIFTFDLHAAWLNSAALRHFGYGDRADGSDESGHLLELDMFAVQEAVYHVDVTTKDEAVRVRQIADAARGLVGIVDFDRDWNHDNWPRRVGLGIDRLRVQAACWPGDTFDAAIERGFHTGQALDAQGLITVGALKIISDGALSARTAWCRTSYADPLPDLPNGGPNLDQDELVSLLMRAEDANLHAAVHAIGDRAAESVLHAFAESGAHGVLEHAQLLTPADIVKLSTLGLVASVQPGHLLGDRPVIDKQWPDRAADAFPLRSLLDAGVPLALGSDAPVIALDPWTAISAAVLRAGPAEKPWHPEQSITVSEALLASTNGVTKLVPGAQADLAVVDDNPFDLDPGALPHIGVALTMVAGRVTHDALR